MKFYKWSVNSIVNFWYWLFPKKVDMPICIQLWLTNLFPKLDLKRVRLHKGLPPILKIKSPEGIVLPSIWGIKKIHIYFKDGPDFYNSSGLGLIAHEMVHVRQYLDFAGGYGLGFARFFILPYLMSSLKGYRNIPLEVEAYDFGNQIERICRANQLPCKKSTNDLSTQQNPYHWSLNNLHPKMERTSISFWGNLWKQLPGLVAIWKFGKSASTYSFKFYRTQIMQIERSYPTPSFQKRNLKGWTIKLIKKSFFALLPTVLIGIVNNIIAATLWCISLVYFLTAYLFMSALILLLAMLWLSFDVMSLIAFTTWSIIAIILFPLGATGELVSKIMFAKK